MKFTSLFPDLDTLLALEPEELAGYLVEYFNSDEQFKTGSIHRGNFSIDKVESRH